MERSSTKGGPPTLHDVAVAAGVTNATASRSLTGAYGVHPDTRKRVTEIAVQLNYKPNRFARGLATGRSDAIGLIISDVRNSYFAEVARGAEDAAYAAGLDILLCNSDLDSTKQMRYVSSLMGKRVEGIIMNSVANLSREDQAYIANSPVPVVLLNRPPKGTLFSTVSADNERGGELAAECLLAHGHRRLIHLTGPEKHANLSARARGFVRAVRQFGRAADASVLHGTHTLAGGYEMAKTLFRNSGKITGISTANDAVAFGVIKAAIEVGIRIPEDVSLIGFDDVEIARLVGPPLTTIRQPKYEMGSAAIEILLRLSSGKDRTPEHRVLGVELIERSSVAAPPARK
ncbi:MAG TPA: LacI family DNA-binding transcriptional regulator [Acidobacteriaceae bacterium]|nr:LacI family DNA-binding transcriptional regulator [Acidobacteriaceae bacterium]